jgi:DNA-binding MarR family transcriptional regulator
LFVLYRIICYLQSIKLEVIKLGSIELSPEEKELLLLDNQICFTVYAASRAFTKLYRPVLEPYNLTYPQYLVLLTLWESDGSLVSDIGKRLFLDSGTLTPLLKRMETTGYINRVRDKDDERKVQIYLTEKGDELRHEALRIPMSLGSKIHLDKSEMLRTKELVDRLLTELTQ